MNQPTEYQILTALHPDLIAKQSYLTFMHDSYYGVGGYDGVGVSTRNTSLLGKVGSPSFLGVRVPKNCYLDRFFAEDIEQFSERWETSTFVPYVRQIVDFYSDLLFKRPIPRTANQEVIQTWLSKHDMGKISKAAMKTAQIYGSAFVVVDVSCEASNLAQAMSEGFEGPEAIVLAPTRMIGWGYERSEFTWIRYQSTELVSDPFGGYEEQTILTTWTPEAWFNHLVVVPKDGRQAKTLKLIGTGSNPFKRVPCVVLKFADDEKQSTLLGQSQGEDIARLQKDIFNRTSELTHLLRGQAFSQLVVPVNPHAVNDSEIKVGVNHVILIPSDASRSAEYISPEAKNADILEKRIAIVSEELLRIARLEWLKQQMTGRTQGNLNSGVSRRFTFAQTNGLLCNLGDRCEEFEHELIELVGAYYGVMTDNAYQVSYPDNYEMDALGMDFGVLASALICQLPKSVVNRIKERISIELTRPDSSELGMLRTEIESMDPNEPSPTLANINLPS